MIGETLGIGCVILIPGTALLVHRAGLAYCIRVVGNWWYALAYAVEAFKMEFRLANEKARDL